MRTLVQFGFSLEDEYKSARPFLRVYNCMNVLRLLNDSQIEKALKNVVH